MKYLLGIILALVLLLLPGDGLPWDQRHEYVQCCHYQGVFFKQPLMIDRVNGIVRVIGNACDYYELDEDVAYALITAEDYFVNMITKKINMTVLPLDRWSFGYTQMTVKTANIVLAEWKRIPEEDRSGVMSRVANEYACIRGYDLLYDYEMNIWMGLYHLKTVLDKRSLDVALMEYNGGYYGKRNPISIQYKDRVFMLLDYSHLWRDGFYRIPGIQEDPAVFDMGHFVRVLTLSQNRLNERFGTGIIRPGIKTKGAVE